MIDSFNQQPKLISLLDLLHDAHRLRLRVLDRLCEVFSDVLEALDLLVGQAELSRQHLKAQGVHVVLVFQLETLQMRVV